MSCNKWDILNGRIFEILLKTEMADIQFLYSLLDRFSVFPLCNLKPNINVVHKAFENGILEKSRKESLNSCLCFCGAKREEQLQKVR